MRRSAPSVAYFLPVKASALLLVDRFFRCFRFFRFFRWFRCFVRAYVIAGALWTCVAVKVGRESHADCSGVNACVDGR